MNAITQPEVHAIDTANAVTDAAALTPEQTLIRVPLSQLRPSKRNVRKTAGKSIDALAESIARVGLLQNLTVIQARNGKYYEVVAGWPSSCRAASAGQGHAHCQGLGGVMLVGG